ncbi:DUF4127 family protein [Nonomuraea sp. CA-143628]|uniref:DUF4127 family protein n=1 Tax=Nonomuraea sp. CA-143628 TaxID=3239997 RepID=UPI003D8D9D31
MAYGGWNTAGNTIGAVVAAAVATVVGTRDETLDRTAARRLLLKTSPLPGSARSRSTSR